MKIEHIAIWVTNLEDMKAFYCKYFGGNAGEKYTNSEVAFHSYFLSFNTGARLELMEMPGILQNTNTATDQSMGYIHLAFSVGSKEAVDTLTSLLADDGYIVVSRAHVTGDGYYESCVLDPEGNRIEITL